MRRGLVITIDGPSGAGKSTAARMLAARIGYRYIDTGAMYRGVACAIGQRTADEDLAEVLPACGLTFSFDSGTKVFLGGEDISHRIRESGISMLASTLSKDGRVRDYLVKVQREMGQEGGVVLEGRDTGSVVFPDADLKFYLDADLAERAKRRSLELGLEGEGNNRIRVQEEMEQRDRQDASRPISPMVAPENAITIDTTSLSMEEVLDVLCGHVERVRKGLPWK